MQTDEVDNMQNAVFCKPWESWWKIQMNSQKTRETHFSSTLLPPPVIHAPAATIRQASSGTSNVSFKPTRLLYLCLKKSFSPEVILFLLKMIWPIPFILLMRPSVGWLTSFAVTLPVTDALTGKQTQFHDIVLLTTLSLHSEEAAPQSDTDMTLIINSLLSFSLSWVLWTAALTALSLHKGSFVQDHRWHHTVLVKLAVCFQTPAPQSDPQHLLFLHLFPSTSFTVWRCPEVFVKADCNSVMALVNHVTAWIEGVCDPSVFCVLPIRLSIQPAARLLFWRRVLHVQFPLYETQWVWALIL